MFKRLMVLEGEQCGERCGGSYTEIRMSENIHCGDVGNRVFLFPEFSGGAGVKTFQKNEVDSMYGME